MTQGRGDGTTGIVCLQGGAEFGPDCADMDRELIRRARGGRSVVVPLAAALGRDYDAAGANGCRHFAELGADVRVAPDFRADPEAAVQAVAGAALVILPGGSPSRLLEALHDSAMGEEIAAVLDRGGLVMGASAGAMVLCEWTWLPDRRTVVTGLGHVRGVAVLPHYSGGDPPFPVPAGVRVLGLPECAGVLVADGAMTPLGAEPFTILGG